MKRLFLVTIAAIAGLIAVILALPLWLPAGLVKGRAAALVQQRTGRDLRIDGPIDLSLFPRPRLTLRDVALGNPPGSFPTAFLTAPSVELSLNPEALFRGAIAVDKLEITRPTITFAIDRQGRRNWIFRRPDASPASSGGRGGEPAVGPERIAVTGGTAVYLDQRSSRSLTATDLDLTASLAGAEGRLEVAGAAAYNGDKVAFALTLAAPDALRRGEESDAVLNVTARSASLAFHGKIGGAGRVKAAGSAALTVPALRDLVAWLRLPIGERISAPLSVAGKLTAVGNALSLEEAQIALGDIGAATGAITLRAGDRPTFTGRLAVERLDLRSFGTSGHASEAAGKTAANEAPAVPAAPVASGTLATPAGPVTTPSHAWSATPLDLAALKSADADLTIAVTTAHLGRLELGETEATVRLKNGRLDLDIPAARLYGGTGTGKIVVDGSEAVPAWGVRLNLTRVALPDIRLGFAGLDRLSGTGDIALDLIGRGKNVREIVASLNGIGGFTMTEGTIGSAGLKPAIQDALGPAAKDVSIPREIAYRSLSATATIARGILRNGDLRLVSPSLSATAAGTIDLSARRIDYLWQPNIPEIGSARIAVTGDWNGPVYKALAATITKPLR